MATMVTGLFDEQQQATQAQAALQRIGVPLNQMSLMNVTGSERSAGNGDNWWERLKETLGFGIHHEDLPYYDEGLRRGGTLLTVKTDESREEAWREADGSKTIRRNSGGSSNPLSTLRPKLTPSNSEKRTIGSSPKYRTALFNGVLTTGRPTAKYSTILATKAQCVPTDSS